MRIWRENRKNSLKWDFGPPYLENSPGYDINIVYTSFSIKSTKGNSKLKRKPETEVVLSEEPSKTAENHRKSVHISQFEAPQTRGPRRCPRSLVRLQIRQL